MTERVPPNLPRLFVFFCVVLGLCAVICVNTLVLSSASLRHLEELVARAASTMDAD